MNKIVLVTGGTSGIGAACVQKFASEGYDVIVTGRRADRLEALKGDHILPLVLDVRDKQAVADTLGSLPPEWRNIDVLVNNAGLALGRDFFDEASMDDWETMIDTNVKGLLYVTRAVLPFMTARGKGHIINLGSTAGKEVYEKGNVYCATKFSVGALSQAMRIDLLRHGIKVTAIHPGAVETEFSMVRFKGDKATADSVYTGIEPLVAEDVADVIYYTTTLPAHVCINDLVLTCTQQANSMYMYRK
ncbi:SDR family NAD(P)-dependent oxidoreductase [Dinghuibacter silviterrae]|uniref:NADP-dependent 3-hydroxy acid dehydrogenase YdfG n=1 Tax=Dinghuibacter silviterrae TaxID=1539049 RepID=A0A4R8DEA7_9BACT|nr:SDR family NAD(P)-dependent oxidoreductase [Dinghuibacter silviterrae]TDW95707.1 NADP-dependent 3-hydroxy acid dehydrogenase YdfG [Dinghuibacter silviterrae]